jgi:biopolymer transport protein ExbB
MIELFQKGGPVMWPLLITSIITVAVVIERILFVIRENRRRDGEALQLTLERVEQGDIDGATRAAEGTQDFVCRILAYGLKHQGESLANAVFNAANRELKRFSRGLSVLDTAITLAPLLGLLGTVTGLIRSFRFLGTQQLTTPTAITGGIAEALIATACGLSIAIMALIPFNYLNAQLEEARHEIEDSTTQMELLLRHPRPPAKE